MSHLLHGSQSSFHKYLWVDWLSAGLLVDFLFSIPLPSKMDMLKKLSCLSSIGVFPFHLSTVNKLTDFLGNELGAVPIPENPAEVTNACRPAASSSAAPSFCSQTVLDTGGHRPLPQLSTLPQWSFPAYFMFLEAWVAQWRQRSLSWYAFPRTVLNME